MTDWLRRAGRGLDRTRATITWSIAEGQRGRRWREVRSRDGQIVSSLLLETDPQRRFSHLELSTAAGLLTLHPEGDGTLHGNTVTSKGVGHLRGLPWAAEGVLIVAGSVVTAAAVRWGGPLGGPEPPAIVYVDLELVCHLGADHPPVSLLATPEGFPRLDEEVDWPLEEDANGPGT